MSSTLRFPCGLYGITPEWDNTGRLIEAIEQAALGGMVVLQWRRKTASPQESLAQATALAKHCKQLGVLFIVNDSLELALATNADGVHLGRGDGVLAEARSALGAGKIVGCSCYNELELARLSLQADVDYIAFGAIYPSSVKPDTTRASLDDIRQGRLLVQEHSPARRAAVVAIGGITPDNAAPVIAAGADSLAVISSLFGAADIRATAARYQGLFTAADPLR